MKHLFYLSIIFTISSCCTPYYATDPLFLELQKVKSGCPLQPCGENSDYCGIRPWTNIEYGKVNQAHLRIGQYYFGYADQFMLGFGANWLYGKNGINGISLDQQVGLLKYKGYFTTFPGLEYNRYNKSVDPQTLSPYVSFAYPEHLLNNFQVKVGYNIGIRDPQFNGLYFGVNTKIPLAHLF